LHRDKSDLSQLHSLGHFLKGSSATLGLIKVRDSCEMIQNYGDYKNVKGELVYEVQCSRRTMPMRRRGFGSSMPFDLPGV
jgi:hypothetical protein